MSAHKTIVNMVVFIAREQIGEVSIAQINKLLTIVIIYYSVLSFLFFRVFIESISTNGNHAKQI